LELIAFGSLIANRDAYSTAYSKISKTWNAGDLLRELGEINPNFYPVPIIQVQSKVAGVFMEHKKREPADYLTQDEFKEVYGRCGVMAHAANPYGKGIDLKYYKEKIPQWCKHIVNLLNAHEIHLVDRPGIYVVLMSVHGSDRVHWSGFTPAAGPS
jgi:hypothetical protein